MDDDEHDSESTQSTSSANGKISSYFLFIISHFIADAQSIPLHFLGVVDIAVTEVNENEVLAHALANVSQSDKAQGWAIK